MPTQGFGPLSCRCIRRWSFARVTNVPIDYSSQYCFDLAAFGRAVAREIERTRMTLLNERANHWLMQQKDSLMALNQAPVGMVLRRELPLLSSPS
jgi:hypothetical protein